MSRFLPHSRPIYGDRSTLVIGIAAAAVQRLFQSFWALLALNHVSLPSKISFRMHHVRISWLPLPTLLPPLNSSSTSLANPSFSTPSEPSINQLEEGKKAEVAPAPLFYLLSLPSPCEIEKNGCALAIQYTTSGLKPDQCFCCCSRMFVNSLSRMTFEKRLGCSQINAKYVRIDMLLESEESVISNPKIPSSVFWEQP